MDSYTKRTQQWLDKRFRKTSSDGVYIAHQPIYGFRKGYCDVGLFDRYILTYRIIKTLSQHQFSSILDVGAAEGYKASLVKRIFNVDVTATDLSTEACRRADDIYKIRAVAADIHNLPFKDNEFAIVLCSETIEHVTDWKVALEELLRVSTSMVIITVPNEPSQHTQNDTDFEHKHIHNFKIRDFEYLQPRAHKIVHKRMVSKLLLIPAIIAEASRRSYPKTVSVPNFFIDMYNKLLPLWKVLTGKRLMASLITIDDIVCKLIPFYRAHQFVIYKNRNNFIKNQKVNNISVRQIIDYEVPYFKLNEKSINSNSNS